MIPVVNSWWHEWLHATSISGPNTGRQKNYLGVDFSNHYGSFHHGVEDQIKYASKRTSMPAYYRKKLQRQNPQEVAKAQAAYDAAFR